MSTILDNREMGNIPISIATALALDGLYNRHPELKPAGKLPALKAKIIYINARTLFRNIHGAVGDNEKALKVSAKEYAQTILQEFEEIRTFLLQETHPLTAILYLPTYHSIDRKIGNGELRPLNTEIQKTKNKLENDSLQIIANEFKQVENKPYLEVDVEIQVEAYQNIFIITHLPVDLLFVKNAADIYLVESHTGRIKGKDLWYTKFHADKNPSIPFNRGTMLFFGDSGGMFKPQPLPARKRFCEVAAKRKWNAHTTKDRLFLGLELEKEPIILKTLKDLFR